MKRAVLKAVAFVAMATLLAGCNLFDQMPHEIEIERPQDGDVLVVSEPFQFEAHFDNEQAIQSAHVAIYRDFKTPNKDTVFTAPLAVPAGTQSFRIDTTLTIEALPGPPGDNFTLFAYARAQSGEVGSGKDVTIRKPENEKE